MYEELNGACFADLNEIQQETIKDYAINVHTIMHQSQPEFVFEVFERLNMGSTQLNEQELRNCIYQVVCPISSYDFEIPTSDVGAFAKKDGFRMIPDKHEIQGRYHVYRAVARIAPIRSYALVGEWRSR